MLASDKWIAALVSVLAACSQESAPKGAPAQAASAASQAQDKALAGLADPSNDKEVVALANKAMACEWQNAGYKWDCADLKAWKESELFKGGKNDKTLVSALGDRDEKVRWLVVHVLASHGAAYRKDASMAAAVVTAAESETSEAVAINLGSAVARIDLKTTGLAERVKKVIKGHKLANLRTSLTGSVLFDNREVGLYDMLQELARDKSEGAAVRRAAVAAFWTGTPPDKHAASCKLWLELAADDEEQVGGEASYMCAFYPHEGCIAEWDPLLDLIDKRAKDGTVKSSQQASALGYLYEQKKASDAQKKRAIAVAKALVDNAKNGGSARARALEIVAKHDPQGKAYAAKLENDPEFFVKSAAQRIKEGK